MNKTIRINLIPSNPAVQKTNRGCADSIKQVLLHKIGESGYSSRNPAFYEVVVSMEDAKYAECTESNFEAFASGVGEDESELRTLVDEAVRYVLISKYQPVVFT